MKKIFLVFLVSIFLSSLVYAVELKINDLAANNIPVKGITFSPEYDLSIAWGDDGSLWRSPDQGYTWAPALSLCLIDLKGVEILDRFTTFAVTSNVVLCSRNSGQTGTWENITDNFPAGTIFNKMVIVNERIYLVANKGRIFLSIDKGMTWFDKSIPTEENLIDINFVDQIGYLISNSITWKTTNNGDTWQEVVLQQNTTGTSITVSENVFFISGYGLLLNSSNIGPLVLRIHGEYTEVIPLPKVYTPTDLDFHNNTGVMLLSGENSSIIWKTENLGLSWTPGEVNRPLYDIEVTDMCVFTTGDAGSIFREALNPTGIHTISSEIPDQFSLSQNYPNPFNPVTKIEFSVPNTGIMAKLTVYDMSGKEVVTLVNEAINTGTYEVEFDGSNLSSGTYFYRLQAGDFVHTKKMILIK